MIIFKDKFQSAFSLYFGIRISLIIISKRVVGAFSSKSTSVPVLNLIFLVSSLIPNLNLNLKL